MSRTNLGWALIVIAGLLEVLWPIGIKQSQNFTRPAWLVITAMALTLSFVLMMIAVSDRFGVPVGSAYAVWTGLGAPGAAAAGIWLFGEPRNAARIGFLAMIVLGVVGLKFTHRERGADAASAQAAGAAPVATTGTEAVER
jgi:quaternary ammonium compound-resistance protein SugE